jgi:hypothetical protein
VRRRECAAGSLDDRRYCGSSYWQYKYSVINDCILIIDDRLGKSSRSSRSVIEVSTARSFFRERVTGLNAPRQGWRPPALPSIEHCP